jgi:hypothetical protein
VDSTYSIDAGGGGLVRLQIWGELRAAGLIKLMGRIGSDPGYRPGMPVIADLRDAYGDWDYSEIQRFRDYVVRVAPPVPCRWAALVRPGALVAAAHVVIVISDPIADRLQMQLFEDEEPALKWVRAGRDFASRRSSFGAAATSS